MKLTIKTLNLRKFAFEFDLQRTVLELKEFLHAETDLGIPAESQQLIYSGQILDNDAVLTDYNIEERRFLVVMSKKPLAVAVAEPKGEPLASPPAPAAQSKNSPKVGITQPGQKKADANGASSGAKSETFGAAAPDAKGNITDTLVRQILPMGYPEADIRRALTATANNAQRAVELLIEGVGGPPAATPASDAGSAETNGGGVTPGPLDFLRNDPRFLEMRNSLRNNPSYLQAAIMRLRELNPAVMDLIRNNHREFMELLSANDLSYTTGRGNANRMEAGAAPLPTLYLTANDRAVIERFVGMGFARSDVIEAYIACDRNEEATGEFLCRQFDEQ